MGWVYKQYLNVRLRESVKQYCCVQFWRNHDPISGGNKSNSEEHSKIDTWRDNAILSWEKDAEHCIVDAIKV